VTEIGQHVGPVELVLLGDFLDLQRMGPTGQVNDRVTATLCDPTMPSCSMRYVGSGVPPDTA